MSEKRPLTDAQEVALITLADRADLGKRDGWVLVGGMRSGLRSNTLESLCKRGFAESRQAFVQSFDLEYRITDEGRALLASMGD